MAEDASKEVQWEPSKPGDVAHLARKQFWPLLGWTDLHDPPLVVSAVLLFSVCSFLEFSHSLGSICLIVGSLVILLNTLRAKPHDNIPSSHNFFLSHWVPFLGHTLNAIIHWNDFYDDTVNQLMYHAAKSSKAPSDSFPAAGPDGHGLLCCELLLKQNYVGVIHPRVIDYLFRTKFGDTEKGDLLNTSLAPMLGNGIFTTDFGMWREHRKIASRIFTVRSLKNYMFAVFNETSDQLVSKLEQLGGAGENVVDIYDMLNRLTLEAFTQSAFGVKLGCIEIAPEKLAFSEAFDRGFQICTLRFFDPTWILQEALNIGYERELKRHTGVVNEFVNGIIKTRIEAIQLQKKKKQCTAAAVNAKSEGRNGVNKNDLFERYDLLSLFLKENCKMTHKQLRDTAMAFIIAGRDTTAQLLSWFLYRITMKANAWVVDRIFEEIKECCGIVVSHECGVEVKLDYGAVNKMQFLENALLETLRLHPSVPHLVKYAKNDIKVPNFGRGCNVNKMGSEIGGELGKDYFVIRKGDGIVIPVYAMNRLPWLHENPLQFDPTRFEKSCDKHKYAPNYLCSFNIAPRLCLGKNVALMEAKIAVVKLLTNFEIVPEPGQKVTYQFSVTNQMKHGFKVKLKKRDLSQWE